MTDGNSRKKIICPLVKDSSRLMWIIKAPSLHMTPLQSKRCYKTVVIPCANAPSLHLQTMFLCLCGAAGCPWVAHAKQGDCCGTHHTSSLPPSLINAVLGRRKFNTCREVIFLPPFLLPSCLRISSVVHRPKTSLRIFVW